MEELDVFNLTTQAAFQGYVESLESKEDALSETAFAAVYLVEASRSGRPRTPQRGSFKAG